MIANILRGESEIILDSQKYILRPTFEALSRVEQELGMGLMVIAKKLAEGKATLEELAVIITHCMETDAKLAVREVLVHSGIAHATHAVAAMLALVLGEHHAPDAK